MKTNFQKIFIGLSLSLVFFLGTNFVYGQSCDIWTQCYQGGCNSAGNYSWFNNSANAYNVCKSDSTCSLYLDGTSVYGNWNGLSHKGENVNKIWNMVNLNLSSSCGNPGSSACNEAAKTVKKMQNTLQAIGCFKQHNEQRGNDGDCMLGYDTLYDMTHCCILPGESLPKISNPGPSASPSCDSPAFLITNAYNQECCLKCPDGQEPIANCEGQTIEECCGEKKICDAFTQQNRDFWTNSGGPFPRMAEKFDIDGCCRKVSPIPDLPSDMAGKDALSESPFCDGLDICEKPLDGGNCDYLGSGYADDGNGCCEEMCPDPLKGLTGDSCDGWGSGFVKIEINGYNCCKQCDNPPSGGKSCEETYGSGWLSDGEESACCKNCGPNKKPAGTGCVCTTTSTDCKIPGDRLNPNTCKCECDPTQKCCGIQLNTVVPFIGDCIEMTTQNDTSSSNDPNTSTVNQLNAFPFLMMGLTKILVTVILIFSFLIVIAAGLMMTTGVYSETNYKKGMEWIKKIVVALILLGSSGLILKLINPSFFGG